MENILITCDPEGLYNKGKEPAAGLYTLGSSLLQASNGVSGVTRVTEKIHPCPHLIYLSNWHMFPMIAPCFGDNTKVFDGGVFVGLGSSEPKAKRQNK